jgi:serine phosphatase RsbU (regulator of sigma subunit)
MARKPGWLGPARLVVGICVVGLLLTGLATWAVAHADRATERRLLQTQTRQAATVLSTAVLTIQQSMVSALDAQRVVGRTEADRSFRQILSRSTGADSLFVSASLWRKRGQQLDKVAAIGGAPAADSQGFPAFLDRALTHTSSVVRRIGDDGRSRIAYALADPKSHLIVYAERAIPADRRAPVDRDSAFADLDYAIYLGPGTDTADMTTTDVQPDDLPLQGLTASASVPFGDTRLTLVATPRHHLGSSLSHRLPWVLLGGGLLLTFALALVARQLVRSRKQAEEDTDTITRLYQRVDTLYGEQRALSVRLQRALLPQVNPGIPHIEVSSEYVAAAKGIDIGGDWYSIIAVGEEHFAFVVGDVSGHGVDAVAEMARARFTLRAYLFDENGPEAALEKCSRQFDITKDGHIITVLVGVGNWRTGVVTVANAGHPLPVLASSTGAQFIQMPVGPPLGAGPCSYDTSTFTIPTGSTVIAYTDGLVERRTEDIDTGLRRLIDTVGPLVTHPLQSFIDEVLSSMRDTDTADDIAVLAFRRLSS